MTITDQWEADPSWPPEQQQLFRRLSDRFATHLALKDEDNPVPHTADEERQILAKINAIEPTRQP